MAAFTAFASTNMTAVNDYAAIAGYEGFETFSNLQVGSVVFPSAIDIYWRSGGVEYATFFGGTGLTYAVVNNVLSITGGTLTTYAQLVYANGQWAQTSIVTGLNYAATSLYGAYLSQTTADDVAALSSLFSGADTIAGGPGDDVLIGYGGNDAIDGGGGINTAAYQGAFGQYAVGSSGSAITVTDGTASRDGTDTLNNIQQLRFTDYTLVMDLHSSQDLLVYELYQAAYGRTPDNGGFRYWAGVADTSGASAVALADSFIAAAEFSAVYGANPSNTTYVTGLYTHVLGRPPDSGGLAYWVGQANAGMPQDQLLVAFAISPENVQLIGAHVSNGYWTTT